MCLSSRTDADADRYRCRPKDHVRCSAGNGGAACCAGISASAAGCTGALACLVRPPLSICYMYYSSPGLFSVTAGLDWWHSASPRSLADPELVTACWTKPAASIARSEPSQSGAEVIQTPERRWAQRRRQPAGVSRTMSEESGDERGDQGVMENQVQEEIICACVGRWREQWWGSSDLELDAGVCF